MADYITLRDLTSQEKDAVLLGRVGGATYHEVSYILKTDADGTHQIVGRASDWPLIQLRAENAEQAALLIAATAHAEQADQHVVELLARLEAAEQQHTALRAELDQAARIPPAMAAAATGLEISPVLVEPLVDCPEAGCGKQFKNAQAVVMHRQRMHGYVSPEPRARQAMITQDDPAWRCANPTCKGAYTRSLKNPEYCKLCARLQPLESANGHALEVGASL